MAGCFGSGIAHYLGINPATLYSRCLEDKGIQFSEYSQQKKEKGDEILRAHQYAKALGLTDKGDNTLLIWLGKTRLKQSEDKDDVTEKDARKSFDTLLGFIKKKQIEESQSDNSDLTNNSTDNIS